PGPRPRPGPDHHVRRQGPGAPPRGRGLRPGAPRGWLSAGGPGRGPRRAAGASRRRARYGGGGPLGGRNVVTVTDRRAGLRAGGPAPPLDVGAGPRGFPPLD